MIIIIIILLFIFIYHSTRLLNGNWQTTEDFSSNGTTIFMNLSTTWYKPWETRVRIIFMSDADTVIYDGFMYFYTYDLRGALLFDNTGYIRTSFTEDIFPKTLYYKYSPEGYMRLYNKKNYGDFVKIND